MPLAAPPPPYTFTVTPELDAPAGIKTTVTAASLVAGETFVEFLDSDGATLYAVRAVHVTSVERQGG